MDWKSPESQENIAAELVRRGLPVDYSERAAAELADHYGDLVVEMRAGGLDEQAAWAAATLRLGNQRALVKKTVREFQRRHWSGRWPMLTFLLAPIPLLLLAWIVAGLALFCIFWPLEKLGIVGPGQQDGIVSTGEWICDRLVTAAFLLAIPCVVVLAFGRLARRAAIGWPWVVVAASLVALSVGTIKSGFPDLTLRPRAADGSQLRADIHQLTLGLPILAPGSSTARALFNSMWNWYAHDAEQAAQLLLPLVAAICLLVRFHRLSCRAAERLLAEGS